MFIASAHKNPLKLQRSGISYTSHSSYPSYSLSHPCSPPVAHQSVIKNHPVFLIRNPSNPPNPINNNPVPASTPAFGTPGAYVKATAPSSGPPHVPAPIIAS